MTTISTKKNRLPRQVRNALEARDLQEIKELAWQYSEGTDSEGISIRRKDHKIAFLLFKAGAELGDPELTWSTADALKYGLGVTKSLSEAEKYYRRAIRLGSMGATTSLGHLYWYKGTDKDRRKAITLYRRAARMDEEHALHNIGVCYSTGVGLKKNLPLAFKYFLRAAGNGHLEAAFKVGRCYLYGKGIKANLKKSLLWLGRAAECGHLEAKKLLSKLEKRG